MATVLLKSYTQDSEYDEGEPAYYLAFFTVLIIKQGRGHLKLVNSYMTTITVDAEFSLSMVIRTQDGSYHIIRFRKPCPLINQRKQYIDTYYYRNKNTIDIMRNNCQYLLAQLSIM